MSETRGTTRTRRLSAAERVERNRQIAEARAAGERPEEIAARFGISRRQVDRAVIEHQASRPVCGPRLSELDGPALVARVIDAQGRALSLALSLAVTAENENARIGALRTVGTVGTSLHLALIRSGLAGDAALERFRVEMERAARVIMDLAEQHGLGGAEVDDAFARLPLSGGLAGRPAA